LFSRGTAAVVEWSAFRDTNLNGSWDKGEQALAGVGLSNGSMTSTTGLDGSGSFTGLGSGRHELTVLPPPGFHPVGPGTAVVWLSGERVTLPPNAFRPKDTLSGSLFVDADGDGRQGSSGQERGLADVVITLTGPVLTTTTTSPNGLFIVGGLPDGTYILSVITPLGFGPVADVPIVLSDGGVAHVAMRPLSQVSGAVYEDWDGDGQRLGDEPLTTIPITMTLAGFQDSHLFGGSFLFWDVPDGSYDLIPAWSAVRPSMVVVGANSAAAVAMPTADPGVVRGTVWHDADGDGTRQPWEIPMSGVLVTLDGSVTATSDRYGRFAFFGVKNGSHRLEAGLPSGLLAPIASFVTGERGAVVGFGAKTQGQRFIFLPLAIKN